MSNELSQYNKHYETVYGERWHKLLTALQSPTHHVARFNEFFPIENPEYNWNYWVQLEDSKKKSLGLGSAYSPLHHCLEVDENFHLQNFSNALLPFYKMDPASIVAARALDVQQGNHVLDLCAAPGGKTLILAQNIGLEGSLIANELSAQRRFRMMSVIKSYIPENLRRRIDVRGQDGNLFGLRMKDHFDRILLDAPCSGDRGLVQKPSELVGWTPKRPKNFAIRQYSLLASAFSALKPGGRIVYSTCAIAPEENDGVIKKLFKKKESHFKILQHQQPLGSATEHGHLILPDHDSAGPIYFAIIEKISN